MIKSLMTLALHPIMEADRLVSVAPATSWMEYPGEVNLPSFTVDIP